MPYFLPEKLPIILLNIFFNCDLLNSNYYSMATKNLFCQNDDSVFQSARYGLKAARHATNVQLFASGDNSMQV